MLGKREIHRSSFMGNPKEGGDDEGKVSTSFMACNRPGSSSSAISEVVNHSNDEDKIAKKRRKIGGNNNCSKPATANGGVDPEPCHHGWVGALGKMRGATAPIWFCSKNLTHTDLDPSQSRLLLPKASVEKFVGEFLSEREGSQLRRCGGEGGGVRAVMVDEMGRCWETRLNLWASKSYNLNGSGWRRMVSRYGLSEAHALKVGAFRYSAAAAESSSRRCDDGEGEEEKPLGFVLLVQHKICTKES